jgi:succinate dehydrogenase / fumarate reductase flavoprotein subunit
MRFLRNPHWIPELKPLTGMDKAVGQYIVGDLAYEHALTRIEELKARAARMGVEGHRQYNPGWHLALDLHNMLLVSEAIARAALAREESRGGHTRDDFPTPSAEWGTKNLVVRLDEQRTGVTLAEQPLPEMPTELKKYFEES